MFNIEKEKKRALKEHEKQLALIEKCRGIEKYIAFVDAPYIYTLDYSYDDCVKVLHEISTALGLKYKLYDYYCGYFNNLHIRYVFADDVFIIFGCNERDKALEKLSKGKCRVVENTVKEKRIACDV